MRVNNGRKWEDLGPRRGDPLEVPALSLRDGEMSGSIHGTLLPLRPVKRTAAVDRPRSLVVR